MRLFYISNARLPTEKAHGLQIMKSCEAFAHIGYDLNLVCPRRINLLKEDPFSYYKCERNFILKRLPALDLFPLAFIPKKISFYLQTLTFSLSTLGFLLFSVKPKDIIYSRDLVPLFILTLLGLHPVAEIHDYRSTVPRWPIRFLLRKARGIVTNSNGTAKLLAQHYHISLQSIVVAPNGVDINFFDIKETSSEAREKISLPQERKIVSYIGRLESAGSEKGVDLLIQAFSSLRQPHDAILCIVGGPQELIDKYEKKIPPEARQSIIFTGHADYKLIPRYLRASDVVVIPLSHTRHAQTTSPIKLFEYCAAGKAIVASRVPGVLDYLSEDSAVLYSADSLMDLANALKKILNDSAMRTRLSLAARKLADSYSWSQRARRIQRMVFQKISVLYFGDFDEAYARNHNMIEGLKRNDIRVIMCHERSRGRALYIGLIKKYLALREPYEAIVVGYSDNRYMVPLARILSRKELIWDAFYSLYDSWVFDRKLVRPKSLKSLIYWVLDYISCHLSKKILLDTQEHINYFRRTFRVRAKKFFRILIGADDMIFSPQDSSAHRGVNVFFHGNFIPLQGVEYIIQAAEKLKDNPNISFSIVGGGQTFNMVRALATKLNIPSVNFLGRVQFKDLPKYIQSADICLGIFGNTQKTLRVIPNKIYESVASGKPVISADTPAVRELFTPNEDIILCNVADADDLARAIGRLAADAKLRQRISQGSYSVYTRNATPKIIVGDLVDYLRHKTL